MVTRGWLVHSREGIRVNERKVQGTYIKYKYLGDIGGSFDAVLVCAYTVLHSHTMGRAIFGDHRHDQLFLVVDPCRNIFHIHAST